MKHWHIIKAIEDHGIYLSVTDNGNLKIDAPKGALTPEREQFLQEHKQLIIDELCNRLSVELLFEIHDTDDRVWVVQQVNCLTGKKRLHILQQYLAEKQKGRDSEPNVIKRENAGRFRANTWLREKTNHD